MRKYIYILLIPAAFFLLLIPERRAESDRDNNLKEYLKKDKPLPEKIISSYKDINMFVPKDCAYIQNNDHSLNLSDPDTFGLPRKDAIQSINTVSPTEPIDLPEDEQSKNNKKNKSLLSKDYEMNISDKLMDLEKGFKTSSKSLDSGWLANEIENIDSYSINSDRGERMGSRGSGNNGSRKVMRETSGAYPYGNAQGNNDIFGSDF